MEPVRHSEAVSATSHPTGSKPRWFRLGLDDVLLLVLVLGIIQRSQDGMLDDPGLGWHLRNVDAMVEQRGWLAVDPFSGPQGGRPWLANQWLGDLVLRLGWWWAGLEGIAAVTTLTLALAFCLLYRLLLRDGLPWPAALFWTYLAVLGTSISWVARPNIFTIVFVMITAWVLERYHRQVCTRRDTLWLLPLFTIWANTHGGFVAGLLMIAVTLVIEASLAVAAPQASDRQEARPRLVHTSWLLAGTFVATLLNPYGWKLYPWVFHLLGNDFYMKANTEWYSPDFRSLGAFRYELLMLLVPILLYLSKRRPSLVALALCIVWLHLALSGQRYVPLWVVVTVPMLARLSMGIPALGELLNRLRLSEDIRTLLVARPQPKAWLGTVVIVIGLLAWARYTEGFSGHNPKNIPVSALTNLLGEHNGQVVFHHYNWGGWLTWHGWPRLRNWIDDRAEVQGQAHIEQWLRLMEGRPGWEQTFAEYGVELVCIPVNAPLAYQLQTHQGWKETYRDPYAVLFERKRPIVSESK